MQKENTNNQERKKGYQQHYLSNLHSSADNTSKRMYHTITSKILLPFQSNEKNLLFFKYYIHYTMVNLVRQRLPKFYFIFKKIKKKKKRIKKGGRVRDSVNIYLSMISNEIESLFIISRTCVQPSSKLHRKFLAAAITFKWT